MEKNIVKLFLTFFVIAIMSTSVLAAADKSTKSDNNPFAQLWTAINELWDAIAEIELIPGPEGPKGDTGDTGLQGEQGPEGLIGLTGPQGATGEDGADGQDGIDGIPGQDGADGFSGYEVVMNQKSVVLAPDQTDYIDAQCPTGKKVIGGGGFAQTFQLPMIHSFPPGTTSWRAIFRNERTFGMGSISTKITAKAICANVD